uniref:Ankyrin repeat domain-containing protein n=1 Tax=Strigamia maritima TaxID=126957 RepID=T1J1L4_STRMM
MADITRSFPLHESVFKDDVRRVSALLRNHNISQKDIHGNSPLHLAVMLGHKDCVHLLLAHGAPVKVKNAQGWSPLAEAISYGDRQTIVSLLRKLKQQSREAMEERQPDLIRALNQMGDFYMELKWDFQSWDTTLLDFHDMKWERGDISFIFNGDVKPSRSLTVLDNELKVYQRIRYEETESEVEDEVDVLMSTDIVSAQMSTKSISFTRAQSGWLFREDRTEMVGSFQADFYVVNGMVLESRKRREHLSEDDLQKNKAIMENLTKGNSVILDPQSEPNRRQSLYPPPPNKVTWEEYITAISGLPPHLGRPKLYKESTKAFRATLAMSEEFPLSVDMLLNVLEVVAPFKHFSKLRDFVQMKLPPGFPVKIDIPILPTVTAKITFQEFCFKNDIPASLFEIPDDYRKDPNRFPDL